MTLTDWLQTNTLFTGEPRILLMAAAAALCIGLSKSGLSGTATLNVVLMAQAFGAKASVGLVLPLLIVADFMGFYINRHGGSWRRILPMVSPAVLGVVAGYFLLDTIDNSTARTVIGWLIIGLLGFKLVLDAGQGALQVLTGHKAFSWAMGTCAGVTTMLANAAGPVMTIYLLSQKLEKKEHLGVFSRFFLFINLFKVPFSADLGIINPKSLLTNVVLLPMVVVGILLGWQILKRIPQKPFEWTLFVMTLVAAAWLIHG